MLEKQHTCNCKHYEDYKLWIFETPADTSDIRESLQEKDQQINEMQQEMQKIRMELLELKLGQVQELQRKEQNK